MLCHLSPWQLLVSDGNGARVEASSDLKSGELKKVRVLAQAMVVLGSLAGQRLRQAILPGN